MDPRRPQHDSEAQKPSAETASPLPHGPAHGPSTGSVPFPGAAKDVVLPSGREEIARDDPVVRDSWLSLASTADRNSTVPSIFSVRASTASTRYSQRQSSIESPISATSPLHQELRKDSLSLGRRYCCTFCDESFESKAEWKLHELEVHDPLVRHSCPKCPVRFSDSVVLTEHCEREHGVRPATPVGRVNERFTVRTAWGCGFCAAYIPSREDYLEHVGSHYDEGRGRAEWQHTRAIEGLLRQPHVYAAWTDLVSREEHARGAKLRFLWDPDTTSRSLEGCRSLQDKLECFAIGTTKPQEIAEIAYKSAQVRLERNVSDLVNKVFTRVGEIGSQNLTLSPIKTSPKQDPSAPVSADDVVSPISPLPAPLRIATVNRRASDEMLKSGSFAATPQFGPGDERAPLFKKTAAPLPDIARLAAQIGPAKQPLSDAGGLANPTVRLKALRRIDSSRNLGSSDPIAAPGRPDVQEQRNGSPEQPPIPAFGIHPAPLQGSVATRFSAASEVMGRRLVSEPTSLPPRTAKNASLSDGDGLVEARQSVELPLLSTRREPTFQTPTFKNSRYNVAHFDNPDFQPEECTPEADNHDAPLRLKEPSPRSKSVNRLSVTKTPGASLLRPHNSSSTLSTHTREGSQLFDDSTSETMSDDSLSEPDFWLEVDGKAIASRQWKLSFHQTVDRGMVRLWTRYNHEWDAMIRQCVGERGNDSSQFRESSGRGRRGAPSRQPLGRGLRPYTHYPGDQDEEDDEEYGGYRPPSSQSKKSSESVKRFACPFRKHDPHTYNMQNYETCAVRSWSSISRLKEHLYRRHYKIHCQRCKQVFSDARQLNNHEMSAERCEVIDAVSPGDITAYQEKQLKSRKHTAKRQTDEEKWADIYRLLFPGEERVPSPYPEVGDDLGPISSETRVLLNFQHFLLTEMPSLFTQTAEEHAGRHIQAGEGLPMGSIPRIIDDALRKAIRAWETGTGSRVSEREISVAHSVLPPETPTSSVHSYGQPATYHPQAGVPNGTIRSFPQPSFGVEAPFVPGLANAPRADGFGSGDGDMFTSATTGNFHAFAPPFSRPHWEADLDFFGGSSFEENPNTGGLFRGFHN
ncbi:hypothetical protein N656DRAFT_148524 [Canariomyces notabilis]|uniref:C2H2-type domain-containing protein n=1 Tax=Canariomyces notabilis TaxID=2074819 RepID=A0AAN6TC83_9PEZI|nr:hypothetical protein N656DRAFT_148524 [Canariomyces arenarius]